MPSSVVSAHEMFEGGRNAMTLVETPALGLLCNNAQLFRASDSGSARGASSLWAERRPVRIEILNGAKGLSGSDGFGLRMRTKEGVLTDAPIVVKGGSAPRVV
jgi:hypothetical protein